MQAPEFGEDHLVGLEHEHLLVRAEVFEKLGSVPYDAAAFTGPERDDFARCAEGILLQQGSRRSGIAEAPLRSVTSARSKRRSPTNKAA